MLNRAHTLFNDLKSSEPLRQSSARFRDRSDSYHNARHTLRSPPSRKFGSGTCERVALINPLPTGQPRPIGSSSVPCLRFVYGCPRVTYIYQADGENLAFAYLPLPPGRLQEVRTPNAWAIARRTHFNMAAETSVAEIIQLGHDM